MGNFNFTEDAWSEYVYWQTQDRKTIKKINKLLESINRNGMLDGEGKPERLKGEFSECYSRKIDKKAAGNHSDSSFFRYNLRKS